MHWVAELVDDLLDVSVRVVMQIPSLPPRKVDIEVLDLFHVLGDQFVHDFVVDDLCSVALLVLDEPGLVFLVVLKVVV